jgi:hypothetical protein
MSDRDLYYDFDGNPIGVEEWAHLFKLKHTARRAAVNGESSPEDDPTRVGSDHVGDAWVSTVWLGLDHSMGLPGCPPLIFETMVFPTNSPDTESYCRRYSTKEQARAGHEAVVAALRSGSELP